MPKTPGRALPSPAAPKPKPGVSKPTTPKPTTIKRDISKPVAPTFNPVIPKPAVHKPPSPASTALTPVVLKLKHVAPTNPTIPKPIWAGRIYPEVPELDIPPAPNPAVKPASFIYRSAPDARNNFAPAVARATNTQPSTPLKPGQTPARGETEAKLQRLRASAGPGSRPALANFNKGTYFSFFVPDFLSTNACYLHVASSKPLHSSPLRRTLVLAQGPTARPATTRSPVIVKKEPGLEDVLDFTHPGADETNNANDEDTTTAVCVKCLPLIFTDL